MHFTHNIIILILCGCGSCAATLPGGFRIGDTAYSQVELTGKTTTIPVGTQGTVAGPSRRSKARLRVVFKDKAGKFNLNLDVLPTQITRFREGDKVVCWIVDEPPSKSGDSDNKPCTRRRLANINNRVDSEDDSWAEDEKKKEQYKLYSQYGWYPKSIVGELRKRTGNKGNASEVARSEWEVIHPISNESIEIWDGHTAVDWKTEVVSVMRRNYFFRLGRPCFQPDDRVDIWSDERKQWEPRTGARIAPSGIHVSCVDPVVSTNGMLNTERKWPVEFPMTTKVPKEKKYVPESKLRHSIKSYSFEDLDDPILKAYFARHINENKTHIMELQPNGIHGRLMSFLNRKLIMSPYSTESRCDLKICTTDEVLEEGFTVVHNKETVQATQFLHTSNPTGNLKPYEKSTKTPFNRNGTPWHTDGKRPKNRFIVLMKALSDENIDDLIDGDKKIRDNQGRFCVCRSIISGRCDRFEEGDRAEVEVIAGRSKGDWWPVEILNKKDTGKYDVKVLKTEEQLNDIDPKYLRLGSPLTCTHVDVFSKKNRVSRGIEKSINQLNEDGLDAKDLIWWEDHDAIITIFNHYRDFHGRAKIDDKNRIVRSWSFEVEPEE